MKFQRLEEDFRKMGMSESETRDVLVAMLGEENGQDSEDNEAGDNENDLAEDEDFESAYVSEDDDDGDGEEIDEAYQKTHRTSSGERSKSKQYYRSHKSQIKKQHVKFGKTTAGKASARHQATGKAGGAHKRWVNPMLKRGRKAPPESPLPPMEKMRGEEIERDSILDNLRDLAESLRRDPVDRFDEYTEAFNHIADLGELLALRAHEDGDHEIAEDVMGLAVNAEDVLRMMEGMDGALSQEEDELLEETLADALEEVGGWLEGFGMIAEGKGKKGPPEDEDEDENEDEDEDEDEEDEVEEDVDNPFFAAAEELREAKGKTVKRPPRSEKYLLLKTGSTQSRKRPSAWERKHGKGAAKAQVRLRKDVRNKEALLSYLKMVKAGKVAPGQKVNKGVQAAKRMAGKGYKGKAKAG